MKSVYKLLIISGLFAVMALTLQVELTVGKIHSLDNFSYEKSCTNYTINQTTYVIQYRIINISNQGLCMNLSAPTGTSICKLPGEIEFNESYYAPMLVEVTKERCEETMIRVGEDYKIDYKNFGHCWPDKINRRVCCVSAHDANDDNIIQHGESYYCSYINGSVDSSYSARGIRQNIKRINI